MTTKDIMALAKKKLGMDLNEQEVQDILDGKKALPDEALEIVSGGGDCSQKCPKCGEALWYKAADDTVRCENCTYTGPAERTFN